MGAGERRWYPGATSIPLHLLGKLAFFSVLAFLSTISMDYAEH